jgi:hypothetical protein
MILISNVLIVLTSQKICIIKEKIKMSKEVELKEIKEEPKIED